MRRNKFFWGCLAASVCALCSSTAIAELPCGSFNQNGSSVDLPDDLDEISGLAVSHSNPEYLWAINDSLGVPELFLINRSGKIMRIYRLRNTSNIDWEDIAVGPCEPWGTKSCIYIGDTGNNKFTRTDQRVHVVEEPDVSQVTSASGSKIKIDILHSWAVKYPASDEGPDLANPDAESLMVHPISGDIYIVSKHSEGGFQRLYRMTRGGAHAGELTMLATHQFKSTLSALAFVPMWNATTSADFAPNGQQFAVYTYAAVYEYDLAAYQDIAEAFKHPNERFASAELQGESITYDTDGKSLITAAEGTGGVAQMDFFACVANDGYVEPEPIQPPDPMPVFESEPEPIYGCIPEEFHEYDDSCEADTWKHCGSHDKNCRKTIPHLTSGACHNKQCVAQECKDDYVPSETGDACICPANAHEYENACEADSVEHCGTHGHLCSGDIHLWQAGECRDKQCIVTACGDGFEPSLSGDACVCVAETHHLNGHLCEADSADNCGAAGNACSDVVDNWKEGECRDKQCVVSVCDNAFEPSASGDACVCPAETHHLSGDVCEPDALENCGAHDVNCRNTVKNWQDGECSNKQCVVSACANSFVPSNAHDACVCPAETHHVSGDICEADSLENCGDHGVNCADRIEHWSAGECHSKQCVVTACADGYDLSDNACVKTTVPDPQKPEPLDPENPDPAAAQNDGKASKDSCSAMVMHPSLPTGFGALWMLGLAGLWCVRRRRNQL